MSDSESFSYITSKKRQHRSLLIFAKKKKREQSTNKYLLQNRLLLTIDVMFTEKPCSFVKYMFIYISLV